MPIYEFACKKCGKHFETLAPVGGEKNICCTACGGKDLQKLISSFGIGGGSNRLSSSSSSCTTCSATSCSTCK
ncbi:MAG: zinc ribbon domain-containing protein [Candidatus Aminicenantaceae bacterium]